jgi:amino acid transporter
MTTSGASPMQAPGALRKNALGVAAITFFVISAAGPLVAMAGGIPIAMLLGNGPGIPAMFVVATLILIAFAAGYTAMARHITNAGAFYAFAEAGLGRRAGAAMGMVAILSYNAMQFGLYGLFGIAASGLITAQTGFVVPWWACSAVALGIIAFFGYRQVDLSAKLLALLCLAEYLVVLILDVAILTQGGHSGVDLAAFSWPVALAGTPAIGLLFCFAAFIGFEATTIYGEEARDPERAVPVATFLSVLLIGAFYIFSTWCVVVGAGVNQLMPTLTSLSDPTTFLFGLSDRYVGSGLTTALSVLFVTSVFASLLAFHNAIARYFYALGRDGLLPRNLAETHPDHASPHKASAAQSIIAAVVLLTTVLVGADPVTGLFAVTSAIGTLGIVVLMTVTSLSVFTYFRARGEGGLRRAVLPLLSFLALAGVAIFACIRFDVLTGSSQAWSALLPLIVLAAAAVGALRR